MAENRYIVTHSNYTIKRKHKLLSGHTIYERDYMTTTNLGGFDSGSIPYGEGNFKIVTNEGKNLKRKHKYGDWLKNENCEPDSGNTCEVFSLSNMPEISTEITSETKIEIKPNKNNFLDFVYYGSCEEMVKSSIDEIIIKFPAELYITGDNYEYLDNAGIAKILGGDNMVVIDNPFDIDISSNSVPQDIKNSPTYNPFRYFSETVSKYRVITDEGFEFCIDIWDVSLRNKRCFKDGDITAVITLNPDTDHEMIIKRYYKNDTFILLTDKKHAGWRIRPTEGAIINFFNGLDDFERFLLERESNPIYSIEVDTPKENDRGVEISRDKYTWPTSHGYNLDISSGAFTRYYESLLDLSEWYDQYRANNLWRNMTHDSIKNMDRTHTDTSRDEDNKDYKIGTTRIHEALNVLGRFFDDIKRSIDNIKTTNTITYNENNNTPDYFLSDSLQLSGWEVKSVVETLDKNVVTDILYSGSNKKYDVNDANLQFFRNLKLNSNGLFSRKGTIEGIEMLLSLFGLCSYDWARKYYNSLSDSLKKKRGRRTLLWDDLDEETKIKLYDYSLDEYLTTIKNTQEDVIDSELQLPVEKYNFYRQNFGTPDDGNELHGLPIRIVTVAISLNDGTIEHKKYMIPWFDKKETLDGEPYFQMYGGWGKALDKDITPNKELYPNIDRINSIPGFTIYDETKKYLKIVNRIDDLRALELDDVLDNDIFYVNDLTDFNTYYPSEDINEATNYFTIADHNNLDIYGSTSSATGWVNIGKTEMACETCERDLSAATIPYKVMYLESIVELNAGNNPHVGYGKYDDGEEYLNYFRQVFRGAIESEGFTDDAYDCNTGELVTGITKCGFNVQPQVVDNVKVWFFTDNTKKNIYQLRQITAEVYDKDDPDMNTYEIPSGYKESNTQDKVNVGKTAYTNGEVGFKSDLQAFNLETQEENSNDEASANSIINTKKLVLKFNDKLALKNGFREYLYAVILPYIKQLIPSTTIFEVVLNSQEVDFTCFNISEIIGVSK
jgi:hypothetical protein